MTQYYNMRVQISRDFIFRTFPSITICENNNREMLIFNKIEKFVRI